MTARRLPATGATDEEIRGYVDWCLGELTLDEKVYMMSGHGFLAQYVADRGEYNVSPYQTGGGCERLGIPHLRFTDGPRGVALNHSTCFPVAMARGASWDVALEERIGEAIGRECRAQDANFFGGVCINLLRHPAWGRAQETYGEDPWHLGRMGAALVRGVQRHNVIATIKHFACNSIENARFRVDVVASERVLREVYLPHFAHCIDEGAASVMSAYNKVNGAYCGHNRPLLRDLLKGEWGFRGFVHSDFVKGVYGPDAATAGLDVENPEAIHFGPRLVAAVEEGDVSRQDVDEAVRRILTTLLRFTTRPDPERYDPSVVACTAHRTLAREAAEKGAVLLQNDGGLLPLDPALVGTVALVGRLADVTVLGDRGSSHVRPPATVTPLAGLRADGRVRVVHDDGRSREHAAEAARSADVAVVVVGYTHEDEGEFIPGDMTLDGGPGAPSRGGDRDRLELAATDEELILAVAAANPRTVVVLVGGSAILVERWRRQVPAVLVLWYAGMEAGTALARLLFGDAEPGGRLPFSIPTEAAHLPHFDKDADRIEYDLYHGYTKLDRDGRVPAYPFGFGLGYTTFEFGPTEGHRDDDGVVLRCRITNTGRRWGATVAQLYVGFEASRIDRAPKLLRGFQKLALAAGASAEVELRLSRRDVAYFDEQRRAWSVEPIRYTVWIAPDAGTTPSSVFSFELDGA